MDPLRPYNYELPDERIAQRPVDPPEAAKMLVVKRSSSDVEHRTFANIGEYVQRGDLLVFNDTKVIPARLYGKLESQTGGDIEIVLIEEIEAGIWTALGFPMRKIREATTLVFSNSLIAHVLPSPRQDMLLLRFEAREGARLEQVIFEHGVMPIPPYIRNGRADDQDRTDYQSIFAERPGSIAAPTASLHFTDSLVASLQSERGCEVERITLHVGTASFQPIVVNGALRMPGKERFYVSESSLKKCREAKRRGGRVIAIGTTVVRALESAVRQSTDDILPESTELFIEPGFEFRVVDALVTNFHQPRTTHLLLVEALLGASLLDLCYRSALNEGYRFLSYGDGMLIL